MRIQKLHLFIAALASALMLATLQAGAQEPLGGRPTLGSKPSVPDLDVQVEVVPQI